MNPIQKAIAVLVALALLIAGILFSVIVIPVILVVGAVGLGYLRWKTRALRKAMAQNVRDHDSSVIEGEAVVVHEPHETGRTAD